MALYEGRRPSDTGRGGLKATDLTVNLQLDAAASKHLRNHIDNNARRSINDILYGIARVIFASASNRRCFVAKRYIERLVIVAGNATVGDLLEADITADTRLTNSEWPGSIRTD